VPLTILDHPVAADRLAQLRDAATGTSRFRELLDDMSILLAVEATRTLTTCDTQVATPVAECIAQRITGRAVLAPILRAGLGFMSGFSRMLPDASIAHLGFYRKPDTLEAVPYYANLPQSLSGRDVFALDPMLATGHSATAALSLLRERTPKSLTLVTLVSAPEGIAALQAGFPELHIVTACVDAKLNEHGYIVPGLGDAGDRLFGTDHSVPSGTSPL
jgi:uracil phosphoribosyltransferase